MDGEYLYSERVPSWYNDQRGKEKLREVQYIFESNKLDVRPLSSDGIDMPSSELLKKLYVTLDFSFLKVC